MSPGQFVDKHPWMTFFLGLGALGTLRVIFRGYEPDPFAKPSTSTSSSSSTTDASTKGLGRPTRSRYALRMPGYKSVRRSI